MALREAIRKVALTPVPLPWAGLAFSPAAVTEERLRMMEQVPDGSSVATAAMRAGVAVGVALAGSVLMAWIGHTHHLAVVAPFCRL